MVVLKALYKKRQTVKMHPIEHHTLVGKEITVLIQALDIATVKAHIMIAGSKHLVLVRLITKSIEKIKSLFLRTVLGKVSAMHQDIGLRQIAETTMPVVRVRQA